MSQTFKIKVVPEGTEVRAMRTTRTRPARFEVVDHAVTAGDWSMYADVISCVKDDVRIVMMRLEDNGFGCELEGERV